MISIGLISYSLYLWHWPLISFVRTVNYGQQNVPQEALVVMLSFALATFTFRFVETPVRRWRKRYPFSRAKIVALGAVACIATAVTGYVWTLQIAPRLVPQIAGLEPLRASNAEQPQVRHHGLLLGDSHAVTIEHSLLELARRNGSALKVIAHTGCAPLLQSAVIAGSGAPATNCDPFYQQIKFDKIEFVIIAARWNYYLGLPPSDVYNPSVLLVASDKTKAASGPFDVLMNGIAATIAEARRAGVQRILIIGPPPEFPWDAPYCIIRSLRIGVGSCTISREPVEARRRRTMETIRQAIGGNNSVRLIDPIDLFCTSTVCAPHDGRTLFFSDTNHLSTAGIERLYQKFESDFHWVSAGNDPGK
jgi:hypothetical protein